MAELDRFAAHLPGGHAATACLVMLDPTTGVLRYCTAGHPPPLLVDGDGGYRYLAPPAEARSPRPMPTAQRSCTRSGKSSPTSSNTPTRTGRAGTPHS